MGKYESQKKSRMSILFLNEAIGYMNLLLSQQKCERKRKNGAIIDKIIFTSTQRRMIFHPEKLINTTMR